MSESDRVTITIDPHGLSHYSDEYLAGLWYVAQMNPAPIQDLEAIRLAERVGREIIRRWLLATPPPLWWHQGEHARDALNAPPASRSQAIG